MKYEIKSGEQFQEVAEDIVKFHISEKLDELYARIEMLWDEKGGCSCRNCVTGLVAETNSYVQLLVEENNHQIEGLFFELDENLNIKKPLWYEYYTNCLTRDNDPFEGGEYE